MNINIFYNNCVYDINNLNKKITGIYKLQNRRTHEIYIGQSQDIVERIRSHLMRDDLLVDWEILKYEGDFYCDIIKECPKEELIYWEEYYIYKYNSLFPNGYNQRYNLPKDVRDLLIKHGVDDFLQAKKEWKDFKRAFISTYNFNSYFIQGIIKNIALLFEKRRKAIKRLELDKPISTRMFSNVKITERGIGFVVAQKNRNKEYNRFLAGGDKFQGYNIKWQSIGNNYYIEITITDDNIKEG